jgi:hypothetical protein
LNQAAGQRVGTIESRNRPELHLEDPARKKSISPMLKYRHAVPSMDHPEV